MAIVEGVEDVRLCLIVFLALAHVADYSPSALDDVVLECVLEGGFLVTNFIPAQVLLGLCHFEYKL